ncbi:Afadin [Dirofilaria immitis]
MLSRLPLAKRIEREQLWQLVDQWNENRLDLFSLSYPTEDLEIHGVMRFYFQESKDKVLTKCIRVSSTATTRAVISALVDKFHPDLKMLSNPEYTLWEVHENGDERCLAPSEKPLLVQLNWHKDDREGRFLLRAQPSITSIKDTISSLSGNRKRFSKKEEKELKKKHQKAIEQQEPLLRASEELYRALPPTTFTRTISNPEVVMKKRREKKIAAKLKDMGQGGSLKIYGYELEPSRPYVTLLVSVRDTTSRILEEVLEKYGVNKNVEEYVLVEMVIPVSTKLSRSLSDLRFLNISRHERIMDYNEHPLVSLANRIPDPSEEIFFVVKQQLSKLPRRHARHSSISSAAALGVNYADPQKLSAGTSQILRMQNLFAIKPCLLQLTLDCKEIPEMKPIHLPFGVMGIGSDRSMGLFLDGQYVRPRHAVINYQDGIVTITPSDQNAYVEVDGKRISHTVALRDGNVIGIAHKYMFRYLSTWNASKIHMVNESNSGSEMTSGLTSSEGSSVQRMMTTFDVTGNVISTAVETTAMLPSLFRINHRCDDSNRSLHLLGIPLPGLAAHMRNRSMIDIRSDIIPPSTNNKRNELALNRTISSDSLSRLLALSETINGGVGNISSSCINGFGTEKSMYTRDTLPALVEVREEDEDEFLHRLICPERENAQFKLTPAYLVYVVARHRLLFPPQTVPIADSRTRLQLFLTKAANRFLMISKQRQSQESSGFWLANSSELLNFFKQDIELSLLSRGMPQQILADCIEKTFEILGTLLKSSLGSALNSIRDAFLDDRSASHNMVVRLEETMCLLRQRRLNAALTIQLFSQLFYYINMVLFNWLVSSSGIPYCSRAFGVRLQTRLGYVNEWAYQRGLELAAECHMDRINQAIILLITPKTVDQISKLGATCYKLNSMQVRWFLEHMVLDVGEEPISNELTESIVRLAEIHADMMATQDEATIQLEEEPQLQLPFLLPQDGYSPDLVRGLSPAFAEVIGSLQAQGLCRFLPQKHSSGSWAIYLKAGSVAEESVEITSSLQKLQNKKPTRSEMETVQNSLHEQTQQRYNDEVSMSSINSLSGQKRNPEIAMITINRGTGGIGLSIVAAQGIGERSIGIYVKKVVDGSAAHRDGRLECGDQLLSVNGQSLIGISQEEAASKMSSSGPIVSFEVYKHAARYNGLYEWLNNPPQAQVPSSIMQAGQLPSSDQQSTVPNSLENVAVNDANIQRFSHQNSATSTISNSNSAHLMQPNLLKSMYNGYPGTTNNNYRTQLQHGSTAITNQQPVKSRSASTSDIYQNPVDKTLTVSLTSLQPSSGTITIPVHSEKYKTNTVSSQHNTMPPHYRNVRPIVIQPSRPTPSPIRRQKQQQYHSRSHSPSHLCTTSALSSSNHHHNSVLKNALSSEYVLSSASSSPITDYANLPLIDDHHSAIESSYSSTSSRNILPHQRSFPHNSTQQHFETSRTFNAKQKLHEQNSVASTSSRDSIQSLTVTAVQESGVVMDECTGHRFTKKAPPVPPKRHITRRDELNEQLDELESKGSAMTEADHQKYRELVNELAKIRVPFPIESNSNKTTIEQEQSKSISPEIISSTKNDDPCFERQLKSFPISEKYEKISMRLEGNEIEEITEQEKQDTIEKEAEEFVEEKKDSVLTNEMVLKKKGVQWNDKVAESLRRPDSDSSNKLIYEDDDQTEPAAQVLGTHEVYRDPRQLRLIELEAKKHAAKEAKIDGSKLGFRDKMQLFAEQIGEKALKNRYKASTIQREIEQTMDDF